MLMTILIRKHTCSQEFNSNYFQTYASLLEHELDDATMSALFEFFDISLQLKQILKTTITIQESSGVRFHKSNSVTTHGYTSFGFVDMKTFNERVQPIPEHLLLKEKINALYSHLGWSMTDYKKIEVEVGEFDEELGTHHDFPFSFEQIEELWERAVDL